MELKDQSARESAVFDKPESHNANFSWFVVCLFFASLSVLLLAWETVGRQFFEKKADSEKLRIKRELDFIRREGESVRHLQSQLNYLFALLSEEKILDSNTIEGKTGAGFFAENDFIRLYFAGKDGELISFKGASSQNQKLVQRIGAALLDFIKTGEQTKIKRYKGFFEVFTGGLSLDELLAEKSALLRVTSGGKPCYFYWNSIFSPAGELQGLLISHFLEAEMPSDAGYKHLLQSAAREYQGKWSFALVDENKSVIFPTNLTGRESDLLRTYGMRKKTTAESKGLLLVEAIDSRRSILAYSDGLSREYNAFVLLKNIAIMLLLLAFLKVLFTWRAKADSVSVLQLRLALVAFFLLMPILAVLAMGIRLVDLYRSSLAGRARVELAEAIERTDYNFIHELSRLQDDYRRLAETPLENEDWNNIASAADRLCSMDRLQRLFIMNKKGEIVFSYPEPKPSDEILRRVLPPVARRIFFLHGGAKDGWKNRMDEMMIEGITKNISEIAGEDFADMFKRLENLDSLNNFTLASKRFFVYSNFIGQGPENSHLMIIWHGSEGFAEAYLRESVMKSNLDEVQTMIMPESLNTQPYPVGYTKYSFPVTMRERIARTGIRQSSVEEMAGEKYLVEAMPLKNIPGYIMFAMSSLHGAAAPADYLVVLTAFVLISLFACLLLVKRILLD